MPSIKNIYVCPRCEESITTDGGRPSKCPSCKFDLSTAINGYVPPITLFEQHERLLDATSFYSALIALDVEKANAIMNDALNIMQTISAKKVPASDIRTMISLGMQIGKIADAYHRFISDGGKHTPGLFLKGEKDELPKTGNGGNAS